MTTHPEKLIQLYQRTQWIIDRQTEGLTHADNLLQLPFRANCMNWVLGHLTVYRDKVLELLGESPLGSWRFCASWPARTALSSNRLPPCT
jgi:hypothetical protein